MRNLGLMDPAFLGGLSADYWFPPTPYSYFELIRSTNYGTPADTLTTPTGSFPGGGAFAGGVLLSDGRVFCVPHNSTTARIYGDALPTRLPDSRVLSAYDNKL